MSTEKKMSADEITATGVPTPGKDTTTTINAPASQKAPKNAVDDTAKPAKKSSVVGLTWVFAFLGLTLLIFLMVFVLQNLQRVDMTIFTWTTSYPLGVGLLLAAIAGALIMALIGSVRIVQLRRTIRKLSKTDK